MFRLLGNILWFFFGGLSSCIFFLTAGVSYCVTIIGIPFGLECFRQAWVVLAPFGHEIQEIEEKNSLHALLNILWFVLFGWALALNHLLFGILFYITILGIPFGEQHFKLLKLSIAPFSYRLA